ncbi:MAG: DNA repair protein RadA [Actinobacteria bacterium]|nr:MAG: DNA repair protein RadA [Actinomycetota bacterium]
MAKPRTGWRCQQCGYAAPKWLGRCPECGEFGTYVEEVISSAPSGASVAVARKPVRLGDVVASGASRTPTGLPEFDRVLGGGLVRGSLVLLAGEPGIGKSTLLLQAAASLSRGGSSVLYVCGEESAEQVKLRAERIGAADAIMLLPEVDAGAIEATAMAERPDVLIVDSIQTMVDTSLDGVAGSVGQVRACAARLMRLAKSEGMTVIVVGHVTKEGTVAGPRVLEHTVDVVLSFEGDRDHVFRIVRAAKNRFGSVSEIGVFEMGESGLDGVANPSAVLLADRATDVAGSCVLATVEGTRPLLVEVQALVTPTYLQMPRRLAVGVDTARVLQSLAVLERRAGMSFGQHDVYVSVAGGVKIVEPAVDLALAFALISARLDRALPAGTVAFGEIGLTGEVRGVRQTQPRLAEAARMGLGPVFLATPSSGARVPAGARSVASVREIAAIIGG